MNTMIILPENDPMGQAIDDFYHQRKLAKLLNCTQYTTEDEFPIAYLFRTWDEMPPLEQKALSMANGKVLDVGAAAGCHSLYLQDKNIDVTAVENSLLSVEVMKARGVKNIIATDFYDLKEQKFDTMLFLMNGIGISGTIDGLPAFFNHCRSLLNPSGQILFDSSDLIYLFTEDDGSCCIDLNGKYYGEITFKMRYRRIKANPFPWLYIDFNTIAEIAQKNGFKCELIQEGEHFDYLAKLTLA
ncbi:MAG: SAM-dependent methyltransferase [Bacteroidales bacterium]|nr:SAM-dependent methyltransferase [Bacteroidales bacterium]